MRTLKRGTSDSGTARYRGAFEVGTPDPREIRASGRARGSASATGPQSSVWWSAESASTEITGHAPFLPPDAVILQDNTVYRELFSFYSTTDVLNDTVRRPQLVAFGRALLSTTREMQKDPQRFFPLISRVTR